MNLSPAQLEIARTCPSARASSSKARRAAARPPPAVARLRACWTAGVPGAHILVLVPQRTLAGPYYDALRSPGRPPPAGQVERPHRGRPGAAHGRPVLAADRRARPVLPTPNSRPASSPWKPPSTTWPTWCARCSKRACSNSISIDRNRLYSQILDNLNKAAVVGFPLHRDRRAASSRLERRIQPAARLRRRPALRQPVPPVTAWSTTCWISPCRSRSSATCSGLPCSAAPTCSASYRHLIADNLEEDTPFAHDLLAEWLPEFEFGPADLRPGRRLPPLPGRRPAPAPSAWPPAATSTSSCPTRWSARPRWRNLAGRIGAALERPEALAGSDTAGAAWAAAWRSPPARLRFYPQMLDWVAERGARTCSTTASRPARSPSWPRSCPIRCASRWPTAWTRLASPTARTAPRARWRDEPAARCLLTLARLAHPDWGLRPGKFEVAYALLPGHRRAGPGARPAAGRDRLPHRGTARSRALRPDPPRDAGAHHLRRRRALRGAARLAGEVRRRAGRGAGFLPQPPVRRGALPARLWLPRRPGRRAGGRQPDRIGAEVPLGGGAAPAAWPDSPLGSEYLEMVQDGVIAAHIRAELAAARRGRGLHRPGLHLPDEQPPGRAPVLAGRRLERLVRAPLPAAHPSLRAQPRLARRAACGPPVEEFEANRETLYRLVLGLLRRCREQRPPGAAAS